MSSFNCILDQIHLMLSGLNDKIQRPLKHSNTQEQNVYVAQFEIVRWQVSVHVT